MRITSILVIIRLLALMIIPTAALAFTSDANENKNQSALIKIENGKIEKIDYEENYKNFSNNLIASSQKTEEDSRFKNSKYLIQNPKTTKNLDILITGYSSTPDQCWGDPFTTASGSRVHVGTMACPPQYPFGTIVEVEGMGSYICEDRGGAIKGDHFDMWFESRSEALAWGKRTVSANIKF